MNQKAITYGIIGGALCIIYNLLLYFINVELLVSFSLGLVYWVIIFGAMIMGGLAIRKDNGGYLRFGKAFLSVLVIAAIILVLRTIFEYVLYNVIDNTLPEFLAERSIEIAVSWMEKFGAPPSVIEEQMPEIMEATMDTFTLTGMIISIFKYICGWALVSLILGLIVKRNPPENA